MTHTHNLMFLNLQHFHRKIRMNLWIVFSIFLYFLFSLFVYVFFHLPFRTDEILNWWHTHTHTHTLRVEERPKRGTGPRKCVTTHPRNTSQLRAARRRMRIKHPHWRIYVATENTLCSEYVGRGAKEPKIIHVVIKEHRKDVNEEECDRGLTNSRNARPSPDRERVPTDQSRKAAPRVGQLGVAYGGRANVTTSGVRHEMGQS